MPISHPRTYASYVPHPAAARTGAPMMTMMSPYNNNNYHVAPTTAAYYYPPYHPTGAAMRAYEDDEDDEDNRRCMRSAAAYAARAASVMRPLPDVRSYVPPSVAARPRSTAGSGGFPRPVYAPLASQARSRASEWS